MAWDDVLGCVVSILLVLGLATLILWLRDRSRDWRNVPDWIRGRDQLRAQRIAIGYRILWLIAAPTSGLVYAFRLADFELQVLLLILALVALWFAWGSLRMFRSVSGQIAEITRENSRKDEPPVEPLG
jgi:hypothetical protein